MKLHAMTVRGFCAPFTGKEISIDFDAIGSGLIALSGDNGSGKTTLLELMGPATLFRVFPSYREQISARSGEVTLDFSVDGVRYTAEVSTGNGQTRAVLRSGGDTIAGPLLKDYDAAVERLVGPQSVFLASAFAVQGGGHGFFDMPRADRKDMFVQLLGLSVLSRLAEVARGQLRQAESRLATLEGRAREIEEAVRRQVKLQEQLQVARESLAAAELALAGVSDRAQLARERLAEMRRAEQERARLESAVKQIESWRGQLAALVAVSNDPFVLDTSPDVAARLEAIAADRVSFLRGNEIELATRLDTERGRITDVAMDGETAVRLVSHRYRKELLARVENIDDPMCRRCPFVIDASMPDPEQGKVDEAARSLAAGSRAGANARIAELEESLRRTRQALVQAEADVREASARLKAITLAQQIQALESTLPVEQHDEVAYSQVELQAAIAEEQAAAARKEQAAAAVQRITGALAEMEGLAAAGAGIHEQIATERQRVRELALLVSALDRDGIQALEIDAAGPAVSAIVNDLLRECYGPRFSVGIQTCSRKKSGQGTKEVMEIRVLDSVSGREASKLSGGETVIVDEALRLAIAIFNLRRHGKEMRTLWRDETTGGLSPANADRYVAMLRAAMKSGGFHQVFFVAHQPEVWSQADRVIHVEAGRVSIER